MNGDIKLGNVVCLCTDYNTEEPYKVISTGFTIALLKNLQTGYLRPVKLEYLWKPKHLNCMVLA